MKLYEYDDIISTLYRAAESEDGIDPETGMVFDITQLDVLEMERDKKIENALLYEEQMKADAKEIDEYIKRLQERSRAKKNTAERIKQWLIGRMQESGESKFETSRIRAILRVVAANKTVITNEQSIPPQYLKTKIEPDTSAIKAALKSGEVVPGAELADSISLTIK